MFRAHLTWYLTEAPTLGKTEPALWYHMVSLLLRETHGLAPLYQTITFIK